MIACNIAPATARPPPENIEVKILGKRRCKITTLTISSDCPFRKFKIRPISIFTPVSEPPIEIEIKNKEKKTKEKDKIVKN